MKKTAGVMMICAGCSTTKQANNTQKGAAIGAASGAVIGGVIGNNVGNGKNTALGAIIGAAVGGVAGGVIGNKMDRQAEAIKNEIPGAEVTRVGEGINVTFNEKNPDGSKEGVYFATNMSDINSNSKLALGKLVKVFNDYPETNILIEGHTDNVGEAAYNESLSEKRAKTVAEYLISNGVHKNRVNYKGYGESQPIESNATEKGRQMNQSAVIEGAHRAGNILKQPAAAADE